MMPAKMRCAAVMASHVSLLTIVDCGQRYAGRIGKSPIHNHGNVCAVIKVLHGSINVSMYNKLELKAAKEVSSTA